jgi:beta-xylosidase
MVSTTMYFAPSVPIMRSSDLVGWSIVGYTGPVLDDTHALALRNGENAYGRGSWAASITYHEGSYVVSVGSLTTGKTYVYSTPSIESGPWTRSVLDGYAHDQSLLFDGDDVYLVYGSGAIDLRRLRRDDDGTFAWDGPATRLVGNANVDMTSGLSAEGAHAYKIGDHYYVFMIEWPTGGIRTEVVWRSTALTPQSEGGTWEGRVVLSQAALVEGRKGDGVAQGGVVQAADGQWYAMLFQDEGPLGRSPQLARVTWDDDGWPTYALDPAAAAPCAAAAVPNGIVASDEFDDVGARAGYWSSTNSDALVASPENASNGSHLTLPWQWNHNPDHRFWSLTERPGHLRLTTGSTASGILDARNTLTQRTYGPTCSGAVSLDVSCMKDGDVAGLSLYQQKYGYVAVEMSHGAKSLVMRRADSHGEIAFTSAPVPLSVETVYLRADADFRDLADSGSFAYSLDGAAWTPIGDVLAMEYRLEHFTGYRFALFCYATAAVGGHVDVDWFRVGDDIGATRT